MEITSLSRQLLFNTVLLEVHDADDNHIGSGTSFIMAYGEEGADEELFLVTNRHVIEAGFFGYLYLTEVRDDKPVIGRPFFIKLDLLGSQFHGHPDPDIDICVCPFSWQLDLIGRSGIKPYFMKVTTDLMVTPEEVDAMDPVQEILFIGYPDGIYDEVNYTPIVRTGTTATPIQLDFSGRPTFLIDASVFPGSSGSPVFSFERSWKGEIVDVRLLGVIAEVMTQNDEGTFELVPAPTQLLPIVEYRHMIDLGVVFKAHLIKETMADWWSKYKRS